MSSKIKTNAETALDFQPFGGTYGFDIRDLPDGSGYASSQFDLGSSPRTNLYEWRGKTGCQTTPTLNNAIELYLATSDGTLNDGNLSTSTGNLSQTDKRRNLQYLGCLTCDVATSGTPFINSGLAHIFSRYGQLVLWNNSGAPLESASGSHYFSLTPLPDEIQ